MIPIEKITFVTKKDDFGDTRVRGSLVFTCEYCIADQTIQSARFDPVEYAKDHIRHKIWQIGYKEIIKPLRELERHALINAPESELYRVRDLVDQLRALLSLDKCNQVGSTSPK